MNLVKGRTVTFYFDIVCPYSYIASRLIEAIVQRNNAKLIWKPVLLGGLYKATKAPQGKDGSATDVMPISKRIIFAKDLRRSILRHKIPFEMNSKHPIKSLMAQRILVSLREEQTKTKMIHRLYEAYWVQNKDVNDPQVLKSILEDAGIDYPLNEVENPPENIKQELSSNTQEALDKGVFGVPSFWIEEEKKLFFGSDRLHFVDYYLGNKNARQFRYFLTPPSQKQKFTFYYDFSSPWSYLGSTQIERVAKECNAEIEFVPILLGALFKEIGTPNVPLFTLSEAKRAYNSQDLQDWAKWWNVQVRFPTVFPIRTVLPLRVNIVEPKTFHLLYRATWIEDKNIGDKDVLFKLLSENGFNAQNLLQKADEESAKEQLKTNTSRAISNGVCGVPSFQIGNGDVIWGQDRLDILSDLLCGWNQPTIHFDHTQSKL